jgi:hypothetical protein
MFLTKKQGCYENSRIAVADGSGNPALAGSADALLTRQCVGIE